MWVEGNKVIAGRFEVTGHTSSGLIRANDIELGEAVVLKFQRDGTPEARELLLNELRVRAEVEHPCLVPYRGLYEHDGTTFLVQKWIDGRPLDELAPERVESVAVQLLGALHCLHERGIVHGDLKPEHVVVRRCGRPTVLDFDAGICRWQSVLSGEPVMISGTMGFMAPELTWGSPLSPATDLFALGATLCTLTSPPVWAETLRSEHPEDRILAAEDVLGRRWDTHRLFGRSEELAQLDSWWQEHAPSIVVSGPGGMGKTSLARTWLQTLNDRGVQVVLARCLATARLGFQLVDALVTAVTGAPVDPDARRTPAAFVELFVALLARGPRVVVWVDDVQSMDPDSAVFLEALLQARLEGLTLLQTTRQLVERTPHTLELVGLGAVASEGLIRHRNPLLIDHDVSALVAQADGVPLLLYHATRGGLAALCTAHRSPLLLALAVALHPVTLVGLAGEPDRESELAELVRVGLVIVGEGPAWSCSHDRVRELVVEQASPQELREAHGRLATWMERQRVHPDIVLNHRVAVGGGERLVSEVLDAAQVAWRQRAWAAAGHWYAVAIDLGDTSQNTLYRAAKGFSRGGQPRRAERQWRELLDRFPAHVDGRIDAAELAFSNGRISQGFSLLAPLMRRVGVHPPGPRQTVAMLTAQVALALWNPSRRPASEQDRLKDRKSVV